MEIEIEIEIEIDIQFCKRCITIFLRSEGTSSFEIKSLLIKIVTLSKKIKTPGFVLLYL